MRVLAFCACVLGCGSSGPLGDDDDPVPDGPPPAIDAAPVVDQDLDGLDDAFELDVATRYLPFIALDPDDGCTRSGLLVRVRPHPQDPTKLFVLYDHLFETDCGLNGHTGDNEAFGVTIDPAIPPPGGILAIKTASHQGTICERVTECRNPTTCTTGSQPVCDLAEHAGAMYPVLYASKNKHGQYATKASCGFGTCFDQCSSNPTPHRPPLVNAGEPGHALTNDLTTNGFITTANGWTEAELMNFDPWGPTDFGSAGNVADDLIDATFEAAVCP